MVHLVVPRAPEIERGCIRAPVLEQEFASSGRLVAPGTDAVLVVAFEQSGLLEQPEDCRRTAGKFSWCDFRPCKTCVGRTARLWNTLTLFQGCMP